MAKGKYKLQSVLDLRERAKQQAARLVAARREQLAQAEEELARRLQMVADCQEQQTIARAKMIGQASAGVAANLLVAHRTHLADLRHQEEELMASVNEQREEVARAEMEVEKAVAALIEASKEVQVMEKHRQSWRDENSFRSAEVEV